MSYRPPGAAGGAPSLAFAPKNEYSPLEPAVLPFPPPPPPPPSSSASMQAQPQQQQHPSSQPQPAGSGKKRSRQSTSGPSNPTNGQGHGVSPDGGAEDGEDEESKARKRRLALSCIECKRRKIKCVSFLCFDRQLRFRPSGSFALNSDVRHIARRLAHLESLFAQTNPGLLPNPSSTNPSAHQSPSHSYHSPNRPSEDLDGEDPQSHSDTEDAAVNLEDVAFAARVPVLQAISTAGQGNKRRDLRGGNGAGGAELTSALTSILAPPLDFDQDGRPRSAVRLGLDLAISANDLPLARSASMAQIFAVLPGKEISDFLIQKYFSEMDWDYSPLDANAFIPEHERYREMLLQNREDSVDPLWVGVFCMVLALSLEGFWSRPSGAKDLSLFRGLTERELQDLPSVWHDAALRALQIGEWGGAPRIRTIQCIILLGQYIQISSSSGQHGRFLNWAASGIRVAQRLGLHRLGSNSETMPPDDPALPPGKNSLKRETAVRLFNILVVIDSLLSDSSSFRCYLLHPSQYNTALPSNLNYSELSRTEWRTPTPAPSSVLTDASFEIAQCKYAAQVRRALDHLVLGEAPFSYTRVLDQDREFRKVLEELPDLFSERCPPLDSVKLRYQRAVLHESVYTRIVRLHRPFLSRGYNPTSQFRYSTEQCVRSAKLIIASNYELLRITSSLWWMYTATLGSAIVIFMDLFHTIDTDMSESAIKEKKDVLLKASILFNTEVASPALRAVVEQGRRILSGLFAAEDKRRTTRVAHAMAGGGASGPEVESFAHILQRISQEVSLQEQRVASAATAAEYSSSASSANRNGTPYVPETAAPTPYGQMAPPQNLGNFEYWPEGLQPPPQQDFTAFFDTLASEDWTAAFNSGSESGETSGLLGQMQATW
ncbi:Zn(2)-C6 fungal-type transcription factor [Pseudohyphozyma bogoriensis]|nr:Zn(2)-C6 fungal-type transcription factor [Pseudohyphozyma bogoriensis]